MHRWGYVPTVEALAENLLGGAVSPSELDRSIQGVDGLRRAGEFVFRNQHERLVRKSAARVASNHTLNGAAVHVARNFTRDLVRNCPFVQTVALSGSVASGGFASGDDVDFDLFVQTGTKYTCYLLANLIGLRYSWRYRDRAMDELHRIPFLPKVTCVNVVWPEDQVRPFVRQDGPLAFELLRCRPLHGQAHFRSVLESNAWLRAFFPQMYARVWRDEPAAEPTALGRCLAAVGTRPRLLALLERASRRVSWFMYQAVQASRRRNPIAVRRMNFLRRVKFPYEVFQD